MTPTEIEGATSTLEFSKLSSTIESVHLSLVEVCPVYYCLKIHF